MLRDPTSADLDAKHQALFALIDVVNGASPTIGAQHLADARRVGWTDEELYFAITVCALFNFYNRWIDAAGVHAMSDAAHAAGAKRSAEHGYAR